MDGARIGALEIPILDLPQFLHAHSFLIVALKMCMTVLGN